MGIRAVQLHGILFGLATVVSAALGTAAAQTIYPLDRAELLAGAQFDLKVEFPAGALPEQVRVTVNGADAASVFAKSPKVEAPEPGEAHTAYWLRNVRLARPGKYEIKATVGDKTAVVHWEVYTTGYRRARNVILLIGDGMSVAHRTAARILSKGLTEGHYAGELAMDDMPHMALVSTSGSDAVVTDSANSASAYTTGHKSCNNAMGLYCARTKGPLGHPTVETIGELVRRRHGGMALGIVTNTEVQDATPASVLAHVRRRRDYDEITSAFFAAKPDVLMGGGLANFLPKSQPGGRRKDDLNYVDQFKAEGYAVASTAAEMTAAAANPKTRRLLGLFNSGSLDGALDRRFLKKGTVPRYPDQPDLVDQMQVALDILSRKPNGFFLMVESGLIDKYTHVLDWERAVYDTIMLDNAVALAKKFASRRNDTLVIVVADHAHPVSIIGTYDDERAGDRPRDKLAIYGNSKFPNYPRPDANGYPATVDVSRRLAFVFGGYPDHCTSGRPSLDGPFKPAEEKDNIAVANEVFCTPQAARMQGNLPITSARGVHAADDVVLTAMGPGAELFRGRIDNTRVFRVMATALGLAGP